MIHLSDDADLLRTRGRFEDGEWELTGNSFVKDGIRFVPVVEAKMVYQFNHRHGDFRLVPADERPHQLPQLALEELSDPEYATLPFYWVPESEVDKRLAGLWDRNWVLGWRDVTDARASARTVIATVVPRVAVTGFHQMFLREEPELAGILAGNLCSFALDFVARQKVGSIHLTYNVLEQLPLLSPKTYSQQCPWCSADRLHEWIPPRVLELTYTAWDLEWFARDVNWFGPPFRWNEERRFLLRCELDAAFFHLYLPAEANGEWQPVEGETAEDQARVRASFPTTRHAVDYIMETFPIVKRKDEKRYGSYLTKETILEIYDEMATAIRTGEPYQTRLDPPPADQRCCHPVREQAGGFRYERQEFELRKVAEEKP